MNYELFSLDKKRQCREKNTLTTLTEGPAFKPHLKTYKSRIFVNWLKLIYEFNLSKWCGRHK